VKKRPVARVLLRGGTIVTMNARREIVHGDLLVEGDRIAAIGPSLGSKRSSVEEIDARGRLVIPGLVQPHVYLSRTLFRGRADGLDPFDWMRRRILPLEAAHTHETLLVSALLGGAEFLRSGTTAILDAGAVHHTGAIFEAAKKLGLRATIGKAMIDLGQGVPASLRETADESLAESLRLADLWHGAEHGRLRYAFAPRSALATSEELLLRVVKEARARGLGMHTHASMTSDDVLAVRERSGKDNVAYLHALGMSGPDTVLAHGVWLTSEEQRILAETGTHVVHCPSSNAKLAAGLAKVPDLLGMGVNVALATDSAAAANSLDAFGEMRLAALLHKIRFGPEAMPAETVFEMATLRGARALGLEAEIGSLEPGKKADLAVVAADRLHAAPADDPYSLLVHSLTGADVEHVLVDGELRVRRGKVAGVDAKRLVAKARLAAEDLAKSAATS